MFGRVVTGNGPDLQIYGESEHLLTEIDVEAEQIYARAVHGRRSDGPGAVQMLETQPHFHSESQIS